MGEQDHQTSDEVNNQINHKDQEKAMNNDSIKQIQNYQDNHSPQKFKTQESLELKISIENFDPSSKKQSFINSPRTLKACEANGIKIADLFQKTRQDVQKLFKGKANLTEEAITQFQNTIELKRLQKVDVVKKFNHSEVYIRKNNSDAMESTGFKNWRHQKSDFDSPAKTQSTQKSQDHNNISDNKLNQKDGSNKSLDSNQNFNSLQHGQSMQLQLQKMKQKSEKNITKTQERQKKDILSMILTEVQIRNSKRMNEMKQQKLEECLYEKKMYLEQKKQEYQKNREKKEQYRKSKEQEYQEKLEMELQQKYQYEDYRQQKERIKREEQAKEMHDKEEQRKKNHEKALLQIKEQNSKVQEKIILKLQIEQEKEYQIKRKQELENQKRKEISQHKVEIQKQRMQKNELIHQQQMEKRENEYYQKQQHSDMKKMELELMRKNILELQRKQAEQKQMQIQQKNEELQIQIEERNREIQQKLRHHEELYHMMLQEKTIRVVEKGQRQKDKEYETLMKKEQNDQEQYRKFHETFLFQQKMIERSNQKKEELLKTKVQRNQSAQFIKRFQVNDNKARLDQMHFYQNMQLQNRLLHHNQRVQNHELEKMMFRQQIEQIERQNEMKKQEMKEKMEKKFHRTQDLDINNIVQEFNLDITLFQNYLEKDLPPEVFEEEYGTGRKSNKMSQSQTSNFYQSQNVSRQTTSHANHRKLVPAQKIYSQTPQGRLVTQIKSQDNTKTAKENDKQVNNFIEKIEVQQNYQHQNDHSHQKEGHKDQNNQIHAQEENQNHNNNQSQHNNSQQDLFLTQQN